MLKDCWMLNQNVPGPALAPRLQELELSWHRLEVACFLLARAYFLMVKKGYCVSISFFTQEENYFQDLLMFCS